MGTGSSAHEETCTRQLLTYYDKTWPLTCAVGQFCTRDQEPMGPSNAWQSAQVQDWMASDLAQTVHALNLSKPEEKAGPSGTT